MYRSNRHKHLLKFLRVGYLIFGHRSLNSKSAGWKRFLLDLVYWLQVINELYGLVAIIHGLLCCVHTVNQLIKSAVYIVFIIETLFNSMYVRWRKKELWRFATEMEQFFIQTSWVNLNRPEIICYLLTTNFVIGIVLFGIVPLFTGESTASTVTVYFAVPRDVYWGRNFIHVLNIVQIMSAASLFFLDMLTILIMWHVACKFSYLARKFTIFDEKKLKLWIKQHRDALSYAKEINSIIAPIAVKSTFAVGLDIIISGLIANFHLNLFESSKFFMITMFSVLRFVACSWVADTMNEKAHNIAWKVYDSPWIYTSPETRKMVVMIMQRSQKSVAIHMAGFLSAWTLKFCYQVLYTVITYLMTLRAVVRV